METVEMVFAAVVAVLAALAVVGALGFALVWEWCAIRRTLATQRHQAADECWRERSAIVPTSPAEHEPIRQGTRRVLAGDALREIALDWKSYGVHGQRRP